MTTLLPAGPPTVWLTRACWLAIPFTVGSMLADAMGERSAAVATTGGALAWIIWAVALAASLVSRPLTLTIIRVLIPLSFPVTVWAIAARDAGLGGLAIPSLLVAAAATFGALASSTGDAFIDGASYGDERRVPLRPPGPLVPVIAAVTVAVWVGLLAGPLLLSARNWVAGAVALVIGAAMVFVGFRALHPLTRRWLVFVPAGLVVHDHLALGTPVLFPRSRIAALGPAAEVGAATDLTQRAPGLAIGVQLAEPIPASVMTGRSTSDETDLEAFVVTPTRPGTVMETARSRGLIR